MNSLQPLLTIMNDVIPERYFKRENISLVCFKGICQISSNDWKMLEQWHHEIIIQLIFNCVNVGKHQELCRVNTVYLDFTS